MTYKLDMFKDILPAIDGRRMEFYSQLTKEQAKDYSFPVVMRFASSVQSSPDIRDWYLMAMNERVNTKAVALGKHPDLQYRLMASCGIGSGQRHPWIAMPKKAPPLDVLYDFIRLEWESANDLECEIILKQIDEEKLVSLIRDMGLSPDRSKEVIEAHERYTGKRVRTKTKAKGSRKKR